MSIFHDIGARLAGIFSRISDGGRVVVIGGADGPTAIYLKGEWSLKAALKAALKSIASCAAMIAIVATVLLAVCKAIEAKRCSDSPR